MNGRFPFAGFALIALLGLAACNSGRSPAVTSTFPPAPSSTSTPSAGSTIRGTASAGPTCPVEPADASPGQCAPRPVGGAVLVITNAAGHEVARVTTATDGTFSVQVPAGDYTITPQPVEGLMGLAPPVDVTVGAAGTPDPIAIEYDTGIR